MDAGIRKAKQEIRPYLQSISMTALWQLCAMAKDGQIKFCDGCKCIRGIVGGGTHEGYYRENSELACDAEHGLNSIGIYGVADTTLANIHTQDHFRNIRLLPMVRAEMKRRDRACQTQTREVTRAELAKVSAS